MQSKIKEKLEILKDKKERVLEIVFISLIAIFISNCSSTHKKGVLLIQENIENRYKPLIGSRNNDARTVIDYGVVGKIWIAPYKNEYGILTAAHDVYVWYERPDFIPGNEVPQISAGQRGIMQSDGNIPFSLSENEIDRSNPQSDKVIQQYINDSAKRTNTNVKLRQNIRETEKVNTFEHIGD